MFLQIELGFMMVGHTHEDVDGMFGHACQHLAEEA